MMAGELYDSRDPELIELYHRARDLMQRLNGISSREMKAKDGILRELFGDFGEEAWVETPFYCDYGINISIGKRTFVNVNCMFMDCNTITLGNNVLVGPNVQIYTAFHPLLARDRVRCEPALHRAEAPYVTQTKAVAIGDNVWIGGSSIIMPGVSIGDNVTVGAGSIVTRNLPADVLAYGQPCRIRKVLKK